MALDFQLVDVKFTDGMDTRTSPKLVVPGKWNLLRNCSQANDGTLLKRNGHAALVATANGNGLATFDAELLALNGSVLSSITNGTTPYASVVTGQTGFVDVGVQQINRAQDFPEGQDVAYGLGLTAYVWASYSAAGAFLGSFLEVLDESTGARVVQALLMNALGGQPRVVFSVNAFFIFYRLNATGTLACRVLTPGAGAPVLGAETALVTSASLVNSNIDCCEYGASASGSVGVSYVWGDGVTSVRAIRVTQTAGVPSIATGPINLVTEVEIPNARVCGIGVCFMTTQAINYATFVLATAGGTTSGTVVKILDNNFASAAALTQIEANVPAVNGACHVVAIGEAAFPVAICMTDQQSSIGSAAAVLPIRRTEIKLAAGVVTVLNNGVLRNSAVCPNGGGPTVLAAPRGPFIIGKPFTTGTWDDKGSGSYVTGSVFLPVAVVENHSATATNTANLQPTVFLLDAATGIPVAKTLYGTHGVGQKIAVPIVYTPSSSPAIGTAWVMTTGQRGVLQFSSGVNSTQTGVVKLAFTPRRTTPPIRAQLGRATYWAGGSPTMYDAQSATEVGFPLFPEGIMAVVSVGGAVPVGTYQAVAIYEWVDGQNQRHQSAPSLPVTLATTGGNQTVTLTAPTLLLSQKQGISIVFYVTQNAGLTFNRLTPMSAPLLNTVSAVSVSAPALALATSITDVAGNELLYTQPLQAGTTLPNDAPGPCTALAIHQNRIFVDLSDVQGAFRYSQELVSGVGLQWNESLGDQIPVDGGALVGFCAMDEKMVLFCARKLYVIVGTGPTSSGGFNNYSKPVEVLSDVGCIEARSILKMPQGIMFKSAKGWYRLGRDLQVKFIGDGADAFDANDVSGAAYIENSQECRFSSLSGTQLIYSYLGDQWSTAQILNNNGAAVVAYGMADAIWWPTLGTYVSISAASGVNRDQVAQTDSPGTGVVVSVAITARTSFLHLPAIEGFQRVRWLYLTSTYAPGTVSAIALGLTVDYDDVYGATAPPGAPGSYVAAGAQVLATYGAGLTVDFRHKLRRQKCKSVAFTFTDDSPGGANIVGMQALAVEVGAKRGTNKLSSAQTVT